MRLTKTASAVPSGFKNNNMECTICLSDIIDTTTLTNCKHSFCKNCILKWIIIKKECPTCPYCRTKVCFEDINSAYKLEAENKNLVEGVIIEIILSGISQDDINYIFMKIGYHQDNTISSHKWRIIMNTVISDPILTSLFNRLTFKSRVCYFKPEETSKKLYYFTI